jgi:predicted Zn-dependent protease
MLACILIFLLPALQNHSRIASYDINNIGRRDINRGEPNFTSIEKEIALGRELDKEVARRRPFVTTPEILDYVNNLGERLIRHSDAKIPITFRVVDSLELNAWSVPGFVYLNKGVIIAAETEAELAAVIAHQIAHIAARHATEGNARSALVNFASMPLILSSGPTSLCSYRDDSALTIIQLMPHIRAGISEADVLGLQYLYAAGFDPGAALRMLEKLQDAEAEGSGRRRASGNGSHPRTADRIEAIRLDIEMLSRRERSIVTTGEFQAMKDLIRN